jgi:hypothetical protein
MERFYSQRDFTVFLLSNIPSLVLFINGHLISIIYDTCSEDLELIQMLIYINLVDVFLNIEHWIQKQIKFVHSKVCKKKNQYIGQLLSWMADDLHFPLTVSIIKYLLFLNKIIRMCYDIEIIYFSFKFLLCFE